jgi:hypothetical protein
MFGIPPLVRLMVTSEPFAAPAGEAPTDSASTAAQAAEPHNLRLPRAETLIDRRD